MPAWYDEAITLLQLARLDQTGWEPGLLTAGAHAQAFEGRIALGEVLPMLRETDVHPPLYYWAAWLWSGVVGQGVVPVRLLSWLAVLAGAVAVLWGAAPWGPAARRIALLAYLIAPTTTWAALNARDYGLALCFVAVATAAALRALEPGRDPRGAILLFGAASALAGLTHYFALFFVLPAGLVLILALGRRHPATVALGVALCAAGLGFAGWVLAGQFGSRPGQMSGFPGFAVELATIAGRMAHVLLDIGGSDPVDLAAMAASLALVAGALSIAVALGRGDLRGTLLLVVMPLYWVGLLALFWATDKTQTGAEGQRYVTFLVPTLAALIGFATVLLRERWGRGVPAAVSVALLALGGLSWRDGGLSTPIWYFQTGLDTIQGQLEGVPPAERLALIPAGFGRGGPGRFALGLHPETRMVVAGAADRAALRPGGVLHAAILSARGVYIAPDESGLLDDVILDLAEDLRAAGHAERTHGVYLLDGG